MNYLLTVVKGFSQIFPFQDNIILGILVAIGLAIASPTAFLVGLIGNVTGSFAASLFGAAQTDIEKGVFGFSGVLIGIVASVYFKQLPHAIIVTIVASIIGAFVFYMLSRNNIQPLASAFVISGWAVILLAKFILKQ